MQNAKVRKTESEANNRVTRNHARAPVNVADPNRVHLILDPEFGQRTVALPAGEPAWIIASPINEPIVQALWRQHPAKNHLHGITVFQGYAEAEQSFLDVLDTVDLHHGEHSARPPYARLEVIGCLVSSDIHSALAELGFHVASTTSEGFSAERSII